MASNAKLWLALRLHTWAAQLDPSLDFRHASPLGIAIEPKKGWVLREDGTGIPVWYRHTEYDKAQVDDPHDGIPTKPWWR